MNNITRSKRLFFLLFLFFIPVSLAAQEDTPPQIPGGFNFDLSSTLGGIYYQDALGIQLAFTRIPFEGTIDKNNYILGV
ncbi:MAG TPA: hypothetical protein DF712_01340, partial [Balneola sp.]|nr:hypothetical protein [Balneola sp.]